MGQLHALSILKVLHAEQGSQLCQIGLDEKGVAPQALPQGFSAAVQYRHAAGARQLFQDGDIKGNILRPAGNDHRVVPPDVLQQLQQAYQVSGAQLRSPPVDRRLRGTADLHVNAALPAAVQLQQRVGTVQVVQQIPDGLADASCGEPQGAGLLTKALEEEGDVDPLAAGIDGLALGAVDLSRKQFRLHRIVQGGVGCDGIDHKCAPLLSM